MIAVLRLDDQTLTRIEVPDNWDEVEGVFEGYDPYDKGVSDDMGVPRSGGYRALSFD